MIDFEIEFASPQDWAKLYRSMGLQVVPAHNSTPNAQWKRPLLPTWKEHTNQLVTPETFNAWYGPKGLYSSHQNMGMLTGVGMFFILDVDDHKHPEARQWLEAQQALHNNNMPFETPTQRTGGGGTQLLFKVPADWSPPTIKTPIGIDVRGQGGFAMLPPSLHESGKPYHWIPGAEPWEIGPIEAPRGLTEAIDALTSQYGPRSASTGLTKTPTPQYPTTPFGGIIDGREDFMTRHIWATVLAMHREWPGPRSQQEITDELTASFKSYVMTVRSRIEEPNTPQDQLLERENRGISMFRHKFQLAMAQWDTKVRQDANNPIKREEPVRTESPFIDAPVPDHDPETGEIVEQTTFKPQENTFEALDISQIMALPDPEWLIDGMIIDGGGSLGFVYGTPGCGKSFICLGIALSIATKQPKWWDRDVQRGGPVIYVSSEGVSDMKHRLRAWQAGSGVNIQDHPFFLVHEPMNFMDPNDCEKLLRTLMDVSYRTKEKPVMVVIDTVSRVLPGADENTQSSMTLFIKACDKVRQHFQATVLGVHHVTKATGQMRGSSVLEGAGDFVIQIDREKGEQVGHLTAKKIKAAADGWTQSFELKVTPTGDIKGTESLYADLASTERVVVDGWPNKQTCHAILNEMRMAWDANRPWSPHARSKAEGRYAVAYIEGFGIKTGMAEEMVQKWQQNGIISLEMRDAKAKTKGLKVVGPVDNASPDAWRRRGGDVAETAETG